MEYRPLRHGDWPEVSDWFLRHGFPHPPPTDALSTYGLIVAEDEKNLAAGWLYVFNGKLAMLIWHVTNPIVPLRKRYAAVKLLVEAAETEARALGCTKLASTLSRRSLKSLYRKLGYIEFETGMTNVIKGL